MRVIAVTNQKGGVGKTTTSLNAAAGLASLGQSVLAVDLDPQAHLTYSLGVMAHELNVSVADCLMRSLPLEKAKLEVSGLELIPASLGLTALEQDGNPAPGKEMLLAKALAGLQGYDFVVIDCPPNLGLLTVNALAASSHLLAPLLPEFLSLQSLGMLARTQEAVRERLNPGLTDFSILLTRFQKSRKLHREVQKSVREHFGSQVLNSVIHENISLAEAPSFGQDIFRYRPASQGARDYLGLAREILDRSAK